MVKLRKRNYDPCRIKVHTSPLRLSGEKKVTAIIIKQQFGFPISTTEILSFIEFQQGLFE